tara:strand:- start:41 stop:613 length:573 start_codon:yes stop_codon:yes gene_type:complete
MQIGSTNTTTINLGVSGDTVNIPSGVTIANAGTATGFGGTFGSTYFAANRTSDETFTNATYGKLGMNNELADPGSNYDTSNYRYTVPSTGIYFFYIMGNFDSGSNGELKSVLMAIKKNGSTYELESNINLNTGLGRAAGMTLNGVISLSASDYVEAWANPNDDSGNPTFKSNSVFGAAGSANQWGGWRIA